LAAGLSAEPICPPVSIVESGSFGSRLSYQGRPTEALLVRFRGDVYVANAFGPAREHADMADEALLPALRQAAKAGKVSAIIANGDSCPLQISARGGFQVRLSGNCRATA
jgi:hypothetical protein